MKYTSIKSFTEIELHSPTLIVFDVDDTILRYEHIDRDWWKAISDRHFAEHGDRLKADMLTYVSWHDEICATEPLHTDEEGIKDLLERAKQLHCKIIFLTARKDESHEITSKHLTALGIEHDEIYYANITGNKGEILNQVITDKYPDFHDYVFVDDVESNVLKVKEYVNKDIRCFKFAGEHALKSLGNLINDHVEKEYDHHDGSASLTTTESDH
jgi:hypothetical protein